MIRHPVQIKMFVFRRPLRESLHVQLIEREIHRRRDFTVIVTVERESFQVNQQYNRKLPNVDLLNGVSTAFAARTMPLTRSRHLLRVEKERHTILDAARSRGRRNRKR